MDIDFDRLVAAVRASVSPIVNNRAMLRNHLKTHGWIVEFDDRNPQTDPVVDSLAAVDGAKIQDRLYTLDLLVARGAAANGRISAGQPIPDPLTWAHLLPRSASTDRVSSAAMAAMEAHLLNQIPHRLRILDGSFVTPLVGLREGLYAKDADCRAATADILTGEWKPLDALANIYTADRQRPIVAITKADTGRAYPAALAAEGNLDVSPDILRGISDRTFAAQVLNPGEYLKPIVMDYKGIHVNRRAEHNGRVAKIAAEADKVAQLLIDHSRNDAARTLFFKPHRAGHTVIKVDYLTPGLSDDPAAVYVEALNQDCSAPHALEPYAQWKVDQVAKQIAEVPSQIQRGIVSRLTLEEQASIGPLILQKYRT